MDKRIRRLKDRARVYNVLYQQMKAKNNEIKDNFPKVMENLEKMERIHKKKF